MAFELVPALAPAALALAVAVALDLALGDPVYRAHPVRAIGRTLTLFESMLRRIGADGYGGGIALFLLLSLVAIAAASGTLLLAARLDPRAGWVVHVFVLYSLLALGDLLHHGWRIERALRDGDLPRARVAVSSLVGRDTDRLDAAGCRRAAVESLSENLTDGFTAPLCWYVVGGIPALVLFKVVSTMDSMVGYRTPRYRRFGWCGARLDDLLVFLPARATWLLLTMVALVVPGCSARKAWRVGLTQHALLPGPNSGWSEAATAGALQRRLVGPIWTHGQLVTDIWLGDAADPPLASAMDYRVASRLLAIAGLTAALLACAALA